MRKPNDPRTGGAAGRLGGWAAREDGSVIEARRWRLTVATGLELHVEEIGPDPARAVARDAARTAAEVSWAPSPPRADVSLGAEDAAAGGPVPIVLVHGIAGSTADWAAVVPDLAAERRVVAYDQRGHGTSGRAPGGRRDYTFDLLLADLGMLVDTLGAERIDLVGHSMGGVIALRYTLDQPGRVRSLVLVDTAAAPANATGPVARRMVGVVLDRIAEFASSRRRLTSGEDVEATRHETNPAQRQVTSLTRLDPDALAAFGQQLGDYPSLVGRLGEISVPTTVIVGEQDGALRDSARTMADAIPGAHLAVIAEADHSPHASRPLAWLSAVDSHLTRLATTPHPGNDPRPAS